MKCTNCGNELPDNFSFCGFCGAILDDTPKENHTEDDEKLADIPEYFDIDEKAVAPPKIKKAVPPLDSEKEEQNVIPAPVMPIEWDNTDETAEDDEDYTYDEDEDDEVYEEIMHPVKSFARGFLITLLLIIAIAIIYKNIIK